VPPCCRPGDFDDVFDEARAADDARTYGRRGLDREARAIVRTLREGGVTGWSVLEVGGGVGAIQLELLRAGAARATNVELSPGYENAARELLARRGLEGRVDRRIGDFVAEAPTLGTADAVVLHRVVLLLRRRRCARGCGGARGGARAPHHRAGRSLVGPRRGRRA